MWRSISFALLFVSILSQCLCSLYGPNSNVIPLTKNNFAEKVFSTEHVWLVEFFAPWCGHCKNLAPEYEKAANNLKGIVRVGAVNCDEQQELCGTFQVKGFPTIKLFPSKLTEVPKQKGAYHKVPEDYQGPRSAAGLANFALSKLPSFVVPVTSSNLEKFLGQELPKALLFTNKDKTSDLYIALSIDFHHRMVLGEAKHSDKKLVEQYGVTNFPTLLVIKDGQEPVKYDGKLSHEPLFKFLSQFAAPPKQQQQQQGAGDSSKSKPREPEPEPETGEIFEVRNQASFDQHCANKGGLCAIALLDLVNTDDADRKKYISRLESLGQKFKGKVRILWMDGPSQPTLTRALDTTSVYPTLVVLNPKKLRYTPFFGAFEEEAISEFFESVFRGKRSIPIDALPPIVDVSQKEFKYEAPQDTPVHDEF
jgi:protein disulfide-isomerase A6